MLLAASYGTVEDIEVLWCLLAAAGLIFSIKNVRDSLGDLRAVDERRISNGRRVLAKLSVQTELIRAIIQAMFLVAGIAATTVASPPNTALPLKVVILSAFVRWCFIASSALLSLKGYLVYKARKSLLRG
jgi:hypothetical protein